MTSPDKAIPFGSPPSSYEGERYRFCDYCKTQFPEAQKHLLKWVGCSSSIVCNAEACQVAVADSLAAQEREFAFQKEMEDY